MPTPTIIEVAAKEVAAELQRQGIDPEERVTLTIEPETIRVEGPRARALSPPV